MNAKSRAGNSEADASAGALVRSTSPATDTCYRPLFELASDGMLVADPQGRYLDVNPAMCRMLGHEREALLGLHAFGDAVPRQTDGSDSSFDAVEPTSPYRRQRTFLRADGSSFDADVTATKLPDGNLLAVVRDVSASRRAHELREYLAAIVESSGDAIIGKNLDGIITSWNAGAEAIFGYTADTAIGMSIRRLIPDDRQGEEDAILARLRSGERIRHFQTRRRTQDDRTIDVSITASPIRDAGGRIVGASKIARDITEQKARERELRRITHLYAALSQVNQSIVVLRNRDALLSKVCQVLVQFGGFKMAWIGWYDTASGCLLPMAEAGDEHGYLRDIEIRVDGGVVSGRPAAAAFGSGQPHICNDVFEDPDMAPWRADLARSGFRAAAAFPIRMQGEVCATLCVYSDETGFFQKEEIALLVEAAGDVSFGLDIEARELERHASAERALNEKRFSETMIDSMPGIVYFYDESGRFLRWNRAFETLSGYSGDEIARMRPLDFFAEEERERVSGKIDEVFKGEAAFVEANFIARDGSSTPYFFTGRRVEFDGGRCLVGVGIDISGLRHVEEQLTASERRYRDLLEHANSIVLHWSRDGRILFLNPYGQRFFGYTQDEIRGRHVIGTIVPETESEGRDLKHLLEEVSRNPAAFEHHINENMRRNGERIWIAWANKVARDASGDVAEILSIGTDVTAQIRAEEALRANQATLEQRVLERTAELDLALHAAKAADRIKSAFLATMSHELRTPLNSIIGFTGILLQNLAGPLNAEQAKQLGMVRASGRHLLDLINDVLDISKIEAGQLDIQAQSFDLHESIRRVLDLVGPLAEKKGLALELAIDAPLGNMISDRRRVEQILINLLSNAIKFTERGRVTLSADSLPEPDAPAAASPGSTVRVRVADTGMGIRPEDLGDLFQPFHQIDSGLARQYEGTGLGLAISRRLCELLGGEIAVTSQWGRGSEFTVTLPRNRTSGA